MPHTLICMVHALCTTAIPLYVWYPEPKMTLPGMHIWHVHPSMLILFGVTTESIPNIGDDMGLQHVISRGHKWLLLIWGDTHIISERCGNYDPVLVMLWWSPSCLTLMTNHVATLIWGYTNILSGCHKIGNDMGYITWYQSHLIWSLGFGVNNPYVLGTSTIPVWGEMPYIMHTPYWWPHIIEKKNTWTFCSYASGFCQQQPWLLWIDKINTMMLNDCSMLAFELRTN